MPENTDKKNSNTIIWVVVIVVVLIILAFIVYYAVVNNNNNGGNNGGNNGSNNSGTGTGNGTGTDENLENNFVFPKLDINSHKDINMSHFNKNNNFDDIVTYSDDVTCARCKESSNVCSCDKEYRSETKKDKYCDTCKSESCSCDKTFGKRKNFGRKPKRKNNSSDFTDNGSS